MKKEMLKNILVNFIVAFFSVAIFYATIGQQQQEALEDNVQQSIAGLSMNIDEKINKIEQLTKDVKQLKEEVSLLKQTVAYLNQKINKKVKVKRDNIFITEAMKKLLEQIKSETMKELQGQLKEEAKNKVVKFDNKDVKLENENKKVNKKTVQIKPAKYHITLPGMLKVSRIDKIDDKIYLYLTNGNVLTRETITNGLKVLRIDTKNNIVYMKVVDPYAYEKGKIYKIPFIIQFDQNYNNGGASMGGGNAKTGTLKF